LFDRAHDPQRVSALAHLFGAKLGMAATAALLIAVALRLPRMQFSHAGALILAATACIVPGTMWMLYNNILLIPATLLLISEHPARAGAVVFQKVSAGFLAWALTVVPICSALYLFIDYHQALALLPFPEFPLPIFLTLFLLSPRDRPQADRIAAQESSLVLAYDREP